MEEVKRKGFIKLLPEELKPYAEHLGELVIAFGNLELQLSILLAVMLDVESTQKGDCLAGIELRHKMLLMKTLGFVVRPDKPGDWYERLAKSLENILNKLGPRRNRMIHDVWGESGAPGKLVRMNLKPNIVKQPPEFNIEKPQVSVAEISELTYDTFMAIHEIAGLTFELKPSLRKYPKQSPPMS